MENVLIIGGGGREHAIAVQLKKSKNCGNLYCIPGNAGIAEIAGCFSDVSVLDFDGIYAVIRKIGNIDMVVVAPDDPLAKGLVDFLNERGIRAFGPVAAAAKIEASKAWAKDFMAKYGIPTAKYKVFTNCAEAEKYVAAQKHPIVIKADGLALGKGVIISASVEQSVETLRDVMEKGEFGASGSTVVIEEFMVGKEVSMLTFCDGNIAVPMVSSQDHKRVFDNDKGPNTGGMGAFSPSVAYTKAVEKDFIDNVMLPTVNGLKKEGVDFKGVLYFGLMITEDGVKVVEYNARFGDPETQVVLPRLKTDLLQIFNAVIDGKLSEIKIEWQDDAAVCVIMASGGYPVKYEKGKAISFGNLQNVTVYHAGTKFSDDKIVTSGGRVLGVTAVAKTIEEARKTAYAAVENIHFDKAQYRKDIGINL